MPLAMLLAFALSVSEPRIPAGGPGGNTQSSLISIGGDNATTHIHATLDAPAPTPLLSTGFPYTEGTRLWEMDADTALLQVDYLFPIRGAYTLTVDETHTNGKHTRSRESIVVPEDPKTLAALAAFIFLLLAAGAAAGSIIAGGAALPTASALCAALLLTALAPAYAGAAGAADASPQPGILWPISAQVSGGATSFLVQVANVEENKRVLQATLPSRDGRLQLRFQFYDGAPHVVALLALRGRTLVNGWRKNVQVSGLMPPLNRRLWVLFEMLLVFAIGYAGGVVNRTRKASCTPTSLA